jgi:hypothetical protein
MTQALAEHVSIGANSARAIMGPAVRNAVQFGSDHFVAIVAALVLFVLGFMVLSGARR